MKKQILTAVILTLGFMVFAQTPPVKVTQAFGKKFTKATNVKWEAENTTEWEAEFTNEDKKMSANFDAEGTWLETEVDIKNAEIPADILNAVNAKFANCEIEEVSAIEKPGFKGYEMDIELGETKSEILVSSKGEITVKKDKAESEKKEDKEND